jgi:regulator of sigma E protease
MLLVKPLLFIGTNLWHIAIGLFSIGLLIALHELGHFLFCKLFGIKTPSFSIGFGPRIFTKKIGDTEFALSAIPLGGYVEIAGAAEVGQGNQEEAQSSGQSSFAVKPFYQKLLVMSGGILFNLAFAYIAMIIVCMIGLPPSPLAYPYNAKPIIQDIAKDSAAQKYGLLAGDRIIAVNVSIPLEDSIQKLIKPVEPLSTKQIVLVIEREGKKLDLPIIPDERITIVGITKSLGVCFTLTSLPGYSFFKAIRTGIELTNTRIIETFQVFRYLFAKRDVSNLAGPLMIVSLTMQGAAQGLTVLLMLLAIISINLAVLNLIPLPILDGGQILFYSIEAIIGRPLPQRVREYIHIATWILMLALFIYLTAHDISRLIGPHVDSIKKFFGL